MEAGFRRLFYRKKKSQPRLHYLRQPVLPTSAYEDAVRGPSPEVGLYPWKPDRQPQRKKSKKLLARGQNRKSHVRRDGRPESTEPVTPRPTVRLQEPSQTFVYKSQPSEHDQFSLENYLLAVADPNAPKILVGDSFGNARLSPLRSPKHFDVLHAIITERAISISPSNLSSAASPYNEDIADRNGPSGDGFFDSVQLSYNLYQEDVAERNMSCRNRSHFDRLKRSASAGATTQRVRSSSPVPSIPSLRRPLTSHIPGQDVNPEAKEVQELAATHGSQSIAHEKPSNAQPQQPPQLRHKISMPNLPSVLSDASFTDKPVSNSLSPKDDRPEASKDERQDGAIELGGDEETRKEDEMNCGTKRQGVILQDDMLDAFDFDISDLGSIASTTHSYPQQQYHSFEDTEEYDAAPAPSVPTGPTSQDPQEITRMLDFSPSFSVIVTDPVQYSADGSRRIIIDDSTDTEDDYYSSAERFEDANEDEENTSCNDTWHPNNVAVLQAFVDNGNPGQRAAMSSQQNFSTGDHAPHVLKTARAATSSTEDRRRYPFSAAQEYAWNGMGNLVPGPLRTIRSQTHTEPAPTRESKGLSVMTTGTVDTVGSSILDFATASSPPSDIPPVPSKKSATGRVSTSDPPIRRHELDGNAQTDSGYGPSLTSAPPSPPLTAIRRSSFKESESSSSSSTVTPSGDTKQRPTEPLHLHLNHPAAKAAFNPNYENRGTQTSPLLEDNASVISLLSSGQGSTRGLYSVPYHKVPARTSSLRPRSGDSDYFFRKRVLIVEE